MTQFLQSKGVRQEVAYAAGMDLYSKQSKKRFKTQLPIKIFGWFCIVIGIGGPIFLLLFGRGFILVSTMPAALGSYLVSFIKPTNQKTITLHISHTNIPRMSKILTP